MENSVPASQVLSTMKLERLTKMVQQDMVLPYLEQHPDTTHNDMLIGLVGFSTIAAKASGMTKERLNVLVGQIFDLAEASSGDE